MGLPSLFKGRLRLPAIGAPMFIISHPDLVIAQCKAGIVGAFPSLSARSPSMLDEWLSRIREELDAFNRAQAARTAAPFAVNLIVHKTNVRLEDDLALCAKHSVPIVITSLGARADVTEAVHGFGGMVMHDVTNNSFARKAVERGADGLIAVAAGAGGHAGAMSPFALVQDIRRWFDGPLVLSGAIASGASIVAAQAMGADLAYIGSAFIATHEANASDAYKAMVVTSSGEDVVYTDFFTGVRGNYLRPSIRAAGLDPDNLAASDPSKMSFASGGAKTWRDIWGCGQGVGAVEAVVSTADLVDRLSREYDQARAVIASAVTAD